MISALLGLVALAAAAQQPVSPATMKTLLLQGLRETHNEKAWFVSEKEAVGGLTAEQASWSDGKNHSVGQLVAHLNFWNASNLARLKKSPAKQVANNDDTFTFDPKQWDATLKEFDQIMTELEDYVQSADDATLAKVGPTFTRIAQHNAYHIGEMVTSRKRQGSWNPENGVK
jgi:DinB family protein